jgi:hypothetical protein
MANFPEEAQPQSPITGSESLLAAKPAASGAIMIYITPAQLKEYIGTGVPANFFDIGNKVNVAFMPRVGISEIDHEQPVVNGVIGDIQIRRAWLRQFIMDLGAELGWGTGTPSTPLGAAAISLGNITENSIGFSWQAVANAASYDIYRGGAKIANVSTTNFNSTGLTASTSYQHYVRAVPASGSNYTTGPASNTITASTTAATGLPTPTAPTLTFNESARTLGAIHASYVNGLERRYNGGAWENAADTASVYVGTDAVAANVYEWRVKAVSGVNLAGTPAGNAAISAQAGPAPVYTPFTQTTSGQNITNNNGTLTYNGVDVGYITSTVFLPVGGTGEIVFDMSDDSANGSTAGGVIIGIGEGPNPQLEHQLTHRMFATESNQLLGGAQNSYPKSNGVPRSSSSKGRLKADGTNITFATSSNGGSTWTVFDTSAQPSVVTFIKAFSDNGVKVIKNVVITGFNL